MSRLSWTKKRSIITIAICTILTVSLVAFWQTNNKAQAAIIDPHPGLVGWWRFDEGNGTIAGDSSGNGNNGTVSGATYTVGRYDNGLGFDGSTSNKVVCPSLSLDLNNKNYTFSAWVSLSYRSNDPAWGSWGIVWLNGPSIGFSASASSPNGFSLKCWLNGNAKEMGSISYGSWHLITVVYTGLGSTNRQLFVDGVHIADDNSGSTAVFVNNLTIGDIDGYAQSSYGIIDDVRLYNQALTPSEIGELFQKSPDFSSKLIARVPKGATQVVTSLSWQGTGTINVTIVAPSQNYTEASSALYQKTSYTTSSTQFSMLNIKRLSVSVSALSSDQNWYVLLTFNNVVDYQISIETQK